MEYNDILQRYFQAQTTPAEEQQFAAALAEKQNLTSEERVAKAMMAAAEEQREKRVAVSLRQPMQGVSRWKVAVAAVACVCVIVTIAWNLRPTAYCYINGRPIYSIDEARRYAEGMFNDLAMADIKQVNSLEELFTLE